MPINTYNLIDVRPCHAHACTETGEEFTDWAVASDALKPFPGVVMVEMLPVPEARNGVYVASSKPGDLDLRPDAGIVIAVGPPKPKDDGTTGDPINLKPGDLVTVNFAYGKHVVGLEHKDYRSKQQVRIYGAATKTGGYAISVPWTDAIAAVITFDDQGNMNLKPKGTDLLIDRGPMVTQSEGGILFTGANERRPSKGDIVAVGSRVNIGAEVGMTVCYLATSARPIRGVMGTDPMGNKFPRDLAFIDQDAVLFEFLKD